MKVGLLSKDDSFRKEFSAILPGTVKLVMQRSVGDSIPIFFDIDTMKTSILKELSEHDFVIAVTKQKRTEPVMEAAIFGAYEIIQRPLIKERVLGLLQELGDFSDELKDVISITTSPPIPTCAIVGHSPLIMDVCKKLARLSQAEVPVLVTGETGTGKELIAETIAQHSSRFGKPFVVVNCAAVPETLLESELFGFEKGSFTGATTPKEGMLRIADEGTVFFDEIGELPLVLQGKLLRFLQTQSFYPLGSTREVQVNVRVISATNCDLSAMVKKGRFREDLYHRLRVTQIHVPPLRERKKDIPPLVNFFVNRYRHTAPRQIRGITKAFLKRLLSYEWPGNIRELENTIRSAIAMSKTYYLTTHELGELESGSSAGFEAPAPDTFGLSIVPFLKNMMELKEKNIYEKIQAQVDKAIFDYLLSYTKENQSEAARILGISRLTLRKKLRY